MRCGRFRKTKHPGAAAALPSAPPETARWALRSAPVSDVVPVRSPTTRTHPSHSGPGWRAQCSLSASFQHGRECPRKDLEIELQTPVPDIFTIQLHAPLKRWIASRSHLPQTGETRSYIEPRQMLKLIGGDVINGMGAGTDNAHVSPPDVPQLR